MWNSDLRLAWTLLKRDWRASELRLLGAALVIAIASLTSVAFFADRIHGALTSEAQHLLGADLLLTADAPWQGTIAQELAPRTKSGALRSAYTWSFVSMASTPQSAELVSVKAVDANYPLRSSLRIRTAANADDQQAQGPPAPGTIWIEPRLMGTLGVNLGDTLALGASQFKIAAMITFESDRGINFLNLAPRIMLNSADLAASQLIQPGSRVTYQLLVAGEVSAVKNFQQFAEQHLERGQRIETLDNARPEIRSVLDRASRFLGLSAVLGVILAAVAIALAAQRFSQRHLDACAIMRCLGVQQARLLRLFGIQFLLIGVLGSLGGIVLGYGTQALLSMWIADLLGTPLPQPSLWPIASGFITGSVLLFGFALAPLLQLKNVPALRILRRELGSQRSYAPLAWLLAIATLSGVILWQAGDLSLGFFMVGGFAGLLLIFALCGFLMIKILKKLPQQRHNFWRYGVANLQRRPAYALVQIVSVAIAMTAILLVTTIATDLIASWQKSAAPDTPNRFIINIQPEQRDPLRAFFREQQLAEPMLYPMVRGRLTAINHVPVSASTFSAERAQRLVEREFNLSWMTQLPEDNRIIGGQWFQAQHHGLAQLSVEQGLMKTLGLKLGDQLSYSVADRSFTAQITSVRELAWDRMRVNFFVIAAPGLIDDFPATYITSFYAQENVQTRLNQLVQRFPNLTVIDVTALLSQARQMVMQVSRTIQMIFGFAIAAGVLVLYTALQSTQDEHRREAAVLRSLGASRRQLLQIQLAEFITTGICAGLLAACGATMIGWLIATQIFDLTFAINPGMFLVALISGVISICITALPTMRSSLSSPPLPLLRE